MAIRQRLVLAGISFELGAIQGDGTELEQLHLAGQQQHLDGQLLQFGQETPPEGGQGIVVGMGVGRQVAEATESEVARSILRLEYTPVE